MLSKVYNKFQDSIAQAVSRFQSWDKSKTIRAISHLDADGISACAILTKILNQENRKYSVTIVRQLDRDQIVQFSKEDDSFFIFADLGSGQLSIINELLVDKEVIILDHHEPEKISPNSNVTHINPHLFAIDGSKEISGAGVVYFFAKKLDPLNENLAYIAIIGAIGDIQEDHGFLPLNQEILESAIKSSKLCVSKGLRLFGRQTRPLHKALEYCSDPFIPGVSGSESGTIQFLHQLGIDPKRGSSWKRVIDLSDNDMQKLVAGVIMRRLDEKNPEDVIGSVYTLSDEKVGTPTRDVREFATLLNACGRMDRASCGIGTCLGIENDRLMALKALADYRKEIVKSLNWFRDNQDSDKIIRGDGFLIINAGDEVLATIIGTLASILSKSNEFPVNTYIVSLAHSDDKTTKISLRISGSRPNKDIDLRTIAKEITDIVGGEAGGHMAAAGAIIPSSVEKEFIATAMVVIAKYINQ